jgi:hypothetical protein
MALSPARAALLPDATLPLAHFAGAHAALALAAAVLVVQPDLPGAFHCHPRMIAVIHLVTLGWITGSILGAFSIVAPLAFGMPFRARTADRVACVAFWAGTTGMVCGFWRADYRLVGLASLGVLAGIGVVAARPLAGLRTARLPHGVSLHVALAFGNVLAAGTLGGVLALGRVLGVFTWPPLAAAAAHAHLAVLGWGVMMIMGVSYRLVPMFLPAAMPIGAGLLISALLLEAGTLGLAWALLHGRGALAWALVILAAFAAFFRQVRRILGDRRSRPAEMQGRDWATWQTHVALAYMPIAAGLGLWLVTTRSSPVPLTWAYGVAGLLGFVAQMIVGIQGRLWPLHAWYRAMTRLGGEQPPRSVHRLNDGRLTLAIFLLWLVAVPLLAVGLMTVWPVAIAAAATMLLASTVLQASHMALIMRRATGHPLRGPEVVVKF